MLAFQTPFTFKEMLSKASGNPVLWHLFLVNLAVGMQCGSGLLPIADLGRKSRRFRRSFRFLLTAYIQPEVILAPTDIRKRS